MTLSSRDSWFEHRLVAQHRPQDIDSASCKSDHRLMMSLALAPLAVVEGSRLGIPEAREGGLVKDPFEDLVAALHAAMVAGALARVPRHRREPGVGGKPVGAFERGQVSDRDEKLSPQEGSHARQTRHTAPTRSSNTRGDKKKHTCFSLLSCSRVAKT